jgi:hypothetical protein
MRKAGSDSKVPESARNGGSPPKASSGRAVRYIVVGAFLAIFVFLLSYGPAVTRVMNRYGDVGPFYCAFFAPAHWLVDHSEVYYSYQILWAKRSPNYHWWLREEITNDTIPLLPSRPRRDGNSATKFQSRPDEAPHESEGEK